jgi:membrane protein YfhO
MPPKSEHSGKLLLALVAVFILVALLTYSPVLAKKIPFPAQMVTGFPPWETVPGKLDFIDNGANYGDIATLFYPWRHYQSTLLQEGELPLWNPHILSGSPFLGNTESALFYPPNATFYFLPIPLAWALKLLLNIVIAGTATALFVRAIGGNNWGAISAGIVFALTGNMTTWQGSMLVDAALWLPLICLCVHRLFCIRSNSTTVVMTAIAFALPVIAGHPETAAHLAIVGILYAFWEAFTNRSKIVTTGSSVRLLIIFAAAGLIAIGLASIQILPTLEWLGQLNHTTSLHWAAPRFREVLSLFSRDIATNPNSSGLLVPESAAYAGTITLLLAPLALFHRNRRESLFFVLLIAVSLQIVFGGPFHWLADQIPVLNGLKNWRFMLVIDFGIAVLAGMGLSALTSMPRTFENVKPRLYFWIATLAACLIATVGIWRLEHHRISHVQWMRAPLFSAVLLVVGLCLIVLRARGSLGPKGFAAITAGLIALDMISYAHGYLPSVKASQIYPEAPAMAFLQSQRATPSRIVDLDGAYGSNAEIIYGLEGVGGWDLSLRRLKVLMQDIAEPSLDDLSFTSSRVTSNHDRRLDLLNARFFVTTSYNSSFDTLKNLPDRFSQVYSDKSVQVFENRLALPRAFFVPAADGGIEVLPDEGSQLARLRDPNFDPQHRVVLSAMPAELAAGLPNLTGGKRASIDSLKLTSNSVNLSADADSPGVIVLSQIYYPGWQVLVDGRSAPILQPDYALTGVFVNNGRHAVRFVYRPESLRIGMAITLSTMFIVAVVITALHFRRRHLRGPNPDHAS